MNPGSNHSSTMLHTARLGLVLLLVGGGFCLDGLMAQSNGASQGERMGASSSPGASETAAGPKSREERRAERQAREMVWEGNRLYEEGEYAEAEIFYRKAREGEAAAGANYVGEAADRFNLGAAVYEQDRFDEAVQQWSRVAGDESLSRETRSKAYFNQGNALFEQEQYQEAFDAFKQSLRQDPGNHDARHNLAMTRQKIQEQQEQDQQNQDQNQDQQDQDQQQDQQDENQEGEQDQQQQEQQDQNGEGEEQEQDQQQQDQQKQNGEQGEGEEEQRPDGQPRSLSPEELERILEALEQDERDVQQKINAQKKPARSGKAEKDW